MSFASILVVSLPMRLVVLGELIAIVGVLLETEHAQPSCRLGLVWVVVLLVVVEVFVGQLSALAEGVGTEGRAGAGLFADGLGGAGGRNDCLAVAAGIGEGVVGGGGGGRSGDGNRLGLHVGGGDGGSGCSCGLGAAVAVGCRGSADAGGGVDLVGGSSICHGWVTCLLCLDYVVRDM
ncbi:MAG: hypothetical protein JOS17DRAFT_762974 [Linnemannia elongata]|nr:MAG: hypothetical protein JOS17DRAFT_762974 [Linnemannia elongata]